MWSFLAWKPLGYWNGKELVCYGKSWWKRPSLVVVNNTERRHWNNEWEEGNHPSKWQDRARNVRFCQHTKSWKKNPTSTMKHSCEFVIESFLRGEMGYFSFFWIYTRWSSARMKKKRNQTSQVYIHQLGSEGIPTKEKEKKINIWKLLRDRQIHRIYILPAGINT